MLSWRNYCEIDKKVIYRKSLPQEVKSLNTAPVPSLFFCYTVPLTEGGILSLH